MAKREICERGRCNQGLANWVAYYRLFGLIPVGSYAIGCGCNKGEAWLIAKFDLRRWCRWIISIEIRSD